LSAVIPFAFDCFFIKEGCGHIGFSKLGIPRQAGRFSILSRNGGGMEVQRIGRRDEKDPRKDRSRDPGNVVKGEFCSGSSTSSKAAEGSPPKIHAHLVDFVQAEDGVIALHLL